MTHGLRKDTQLVMYDPYCIQCLQITVSDQVGPQVKWAVSLVIADLPQGFVYVWGNILTLFPLKVHYCNVIVLLEELFKCKLFM